MKGTLATAKSSSSVVAKSSSSVAGITAVAPVAGFNASLQGNTLQVSVVRAGIVNVQVFDMMGHVIESHSENMTAGSFAHTFGAIAQGHYVVRVQQGSAVRTLQMQIR